MMKISGTILFKEIQHFRVQWLWWLIIIGLLAPVGITLGLAITEKEKAAEAWIALAFVIPFEVVILYLFYINRLETVVNNVGVLYKWWLFQRAYRFIARAEIDKAELRKGPLLSYGFHWIPGFGKVHNMGPGKGIQFILKNGRKIFLGTQKQSAFQTALEKIMSVPRKQ